MIWSWFRWRCHMEIMRQEVFWNLRFVLNCRVYFPQAHTSCFGVDIVILVGKHLQGISCKDTAWIQDYFMSGSIVCRSANLQQTYTNPSLPSYLCGQWHC